VEVKNKEDAKNEDAEVEAEHYEVATGVRCVGAPAHLAGWRVRVELDQTIPTLFPLFAGADWQEREQYDLVGVRFDDHPDLRRLMMPEDWEGYPLRKDYAIETACPPWR
jgi:Ni,Fe-hydrogenase III component G